MSTTSTPIENVVVKFGTTTKELAPTIFNDETLQLNGFFNVLQNAIPELKSKEKQTFIVLYKGEKVSVSTKKSDLVKEMKTQILKKHPVLVDFEAIGSEGAKIMKKFLADTVKQISNNSLFNMVKLVGALSTEKSIFDVVGGLTELCENAANVASISVETLKAEREAEALKTAPKTEATA